MAISNFDTLGDVKRRFPDFDFKSGFDDQMKVFVKSNDDDVFGPEVAGLDALRQTDAIRIAKVIGVGEADAGGFCADPGGD